jgi:hypothetical protein
MVSLGMEEKIETKLIASKAGGDHLGDVLEAGFGDLCARTLRPLQMPKWRDLNPACLSNSPKIVLRLQTEPNFR